jgi:hypothetical protein
MVSVLTIWPNVSEFKSGWGAGFLRATNIRSTPSFVGKVKLSAPCHKILRHVRNHSQVWTRILRRLNSTFISPNSSWFATKWLCQQDCQIAVMDESGVLPCRHYSTVVLHAHISPGEWKLGPLVAAVQRRILTPLTRSLSNRSTKVSVTIQKLSQS